MPHLTFINSAEEDIEEDTDEQRAHGHPPSEGLKKKRKEKADDIEYGFLPLLLKAEKIMSFQSREQGNFL